MCTVFRLTTPVLAVRVDYNGRPSDIYRPISSKTAQLPTEPVKDDRPISAKKKLIYSNRTVSYSNRAVEQLLKRCS